MSSAPFALRRVPCVVRRASYVVRLFFPHIYSLNNNLHENNSKTSYDLWKPWIGTDKCGTGNKLQFQFLAN